MAHPEFKSSYCINTTRADINHRLIQTQLHAFDLSLSRNFQEFSKIDLKSEIDIYGFLLSIIDFCTGHQVPYEQSARKIENPADRIWFSEVGNKYVAQHQLGIAPALVEHIDVLRDCLYYLHQYEVVSAISEQQKANENHVLPA